MKPYSIFLLISIISLTVSAQEYCEVSYTQDIEPITRVIFAGIDHTTSPEINGTPGHEYFEDELGLFDPTSSDFIILEGNTNGNYTNTFTVFIDWNQNGDFTDEGEMYFAGSITNSSGTDGQQAITEIIAPEYVDIAETRIRIIKHRTDSQTPVWPTDPCGVYEYGQTEDYPLIVNPVDPPPCNAIYPGIMEDGLGNLQTRRYAADFEIATISGEPVYVNYLKLNIFNNISTANLYFYKDNNGKPGNLVGSFENIEPVSQLLNGTVFGFFIYETTFEFPLVPVGVVDDIYWIAIETTAGSDGEANFWETSISVANQPAYYSDDGGNSWHQQTEGMDAAFEIWGECGQLDLNESGQRYEFSYYPNPVNDVLKIHSSEKIKQLTVFDASGAEKLKLSTPVNGEINLRKLPPNLYFIRVLLENGAIETFKIIKK